MKDVLAFAAVTAPTYAAMVWINRRYARLVEVITRPWWGLALWLLLCAGVPAGLGILAAWAVS